jgi:SAM-dependent methyltransferase
MLQPSDLRACNVFTTQEERDFYIGAAYGRFVVTIEVVKQLVGNALGARIFEFGANPYFLTYMLITELNRPRLRLANWFGPQPEFSGPGTHFQNTDAARFAFQHFNIEDMSDPEWGGVGRDYDVVLYCEILEHMLVEPAPTMRKIHGMLRSGGHLILTTPNVFSAYNKGLWESGLNIYEGYSPNGPYGRHNRVWSIAEVLEASRDWGFKVEACFTVDAADGKTGGEDQAGDTIITVLEA